MVANYLLEVTILRVFRQTHTEGLHILWGPETFTVIVGALSYKVLFYLYIKM